MAKEEIKNPFEGESFESLSKEVNEEKEKNADKNAMKLVRVKIACNNPNKTNYTCEIFTVKNSQIEIKKCVPFNVKTHIPQIMYNMLKDKECTIFVTKRVDGRPVTKTKLIKEYNIEVLPPITTEELEAIKQKQLAEQSQEV